ncbi:MAG: TatD family deoxyribonuclease [Bacteroidetes bacterium]|nr:MAG: TatD family deoxyribonuclease [Bacteroidota bacterium]
MLIDTHAHLYLPQFDPDREEVLARAKAAGVGRVYLPNIDMSSVEALLELEAAEPDFCFPMMGLHPCSVKADWERELAGVERWLSERPFVAVGEIGLDLYWDESTLAAQREAFRRQVRWAKELGLPIVIHSREATRQVLDLLQEEHDERLRGIFHCFSGSAEEARETVELGFYLGIGGVLTFKNAGLREAIADIPLEWLVLETDAPYLAPMPYRGKRNESAYVRLVAERLAALKNRPLEEVEAQTTANALKIFGA